MANYKVPRYFEIVDALPLNASGKVLKYELRERAPGPARIGRWPTPQRCASAESSDLMRAYHDDEWGTPSHDDTHLFEMLILEGAQAGLSWSTILNKRENYRRAFDGFDPNASRATATRRSHALLDDPGIVRNRLKVASTVAQRRKRSSRRAASTDRSRDYLWDWVDGDTDRQPAPHDRRSPAAHRAVRPPRQGH